MPEPPSPFSYTILRLVPSVERGERMNVGVVLFCRQLGFLGARVELDRDRLAGFGSGVSVPELAAHLDGLVRVAGRREPLNTCRPGDGGIVLFLSPGHSSPTEVCWARDLSTG